MTISITVALITSLLIEYPFNNLEKLIFNRSGGIKNSKKLKIENIENIKIEKNNLYLNRINENEKQIPFVNQI